MTIQNQRERNEKTQFQHYQPLQTKTLTLRVPTNPTKKTLTKTMTTQRQKERTEKIHQYQYQ